MTISSGQRTALGAGFLRWACVALVALGQTLAFETVARAAADPAIIEAPRTLISETGDKILVILAKRDQTVESRIRQIEEIAYEVFDFTTMSKLVLAREWRKLDKEKRAEFVREFKLHLSNTYGTRLDRYEQEKIEVFGSQVEPRDDVTIKTKIVGGQFNDAVISYRLRENDGQWRIIDVVIEGVSLVSNYRSQFAEVLSTGTIDDLLAKLRDKNFKIDDGSSEADTESKKDAK
jgi:phospholipid transport system substrate-binding protein